MTAIKKLFIADLTQAPPPFSLGRWETKPEEMNQEAPVSTPFKTDKQDSATGGPRLTKTLTANLDWIHAHFSLDVSRGLVIRHLNITSAAVPAALLYIDDQVDWQHLNRVVLTPLLHGRFSPTVAPDPELLIHTVLTEGQVSSSPDWSHVSDSLLIGCAVILVEGVDVAVIVEAKGWAMRAVDRPTAEITVRGPQEGFTEDIRTNLSLVRRRLRTADLIVELTQIGELSQTDLAVVYLKSVANPRLVAEVRRRIRSIQTDYIADSGSVEQYIEDRTYSIYPNLLSTERPDRVAAQIAEGYVGILVGNSPFSLVVPGTFAMFLHTPEDVYLRWPYGSFLRGIRAAAFLISLLLPALYVAIANFHHEMIPTALMMAITAARETVPLPIVLEVWFMESMFELIREAGVRVPSVIGPTIGIVGALILGQAAVQAGVISPILVIITSATALASFAIPNYNLQFATRVLRFGYIAAAAMFGLVGIAVIFLAMTAYLGAGNSFGVPWLSPVTPPGRGGDTLVRSAVFLQEKRPGQVRPQQIRRQPRIIRTWEGENSKVDKAKEQHDEP